MVWRNNKYWEARRTLNRLRSGAAVVVVGRVRLQLQMVGDVSNARTHTGDDPCAGRRCLCGPPPCCLLDDIKARWIVPSAVLSTRSALVVCSGGRSNRSSSSAATTSSPRSCALLLGYALARLVQR